MKYYAVTEDPRELYHYGVKGMKWGQHIFGDKPKSPGYHKALGKLRSIKKAATAGAKTVAKTVTPKVQKLGTAAKKSAGQVAYNIRAAQEKRFNKAIERSQKRYDKIDQKIENYYANKPVKDAKRAANVAKAKEAVSAVASFAKNAPGQVVYNVRRHEENKFNKAVKKAQDRNRLSDALRGLDREEKLIKQADRERKMNDLLEKQADIKADNDLKTLGQAVKVEKNMPKYFQEARTGTLAYGKLSDEQIGRLQNRLALEANTRRLGSTEAPSWREQKKMARREGYLQGITRGTSAAMEEVARAGIQYGVQNLMNRKKLDKASELRAEREKNANRIKNKKTRSEMREDVKQEAYETQIKSGVGAIHRANLTATKAGRNIKDVKNMERIRQEKLDEAREERKFLMDERHNAARAERQDRENEARDERKFLMDEQHNAIRETRQNKQRLEGQAMDNDEIGKSLHEHGYAVIPRYNKDGKKTGQILLTAKGNSGEDNGAAYLALYKSKYKNEIASKEKEAAERQKAKEKEAAEHQKQVDEYTNKVLNEEMKKIAKDRENEAFRQAINDRAAQVKKERQEAKDKKKTEREIQKTFDNLINTANIYDPASEQRRVERYNRYPKGSIGYADDIGLFIPNKPRRRRRSSG